MRLTFFLSRFVFAKTFLRKTVILKHTNKISQAPEKSFSMVAVPAGSFIMGSDEKAIIKKVDEQPAHKVTIEAFWMGAYEVTYDEYDEFSKDQTLSHDVEVDAVARPTPHT